MFRNRTRRIRDGLAVAVLVTAMFGAGSPAALALSPAAVIPDRGAMPGVSSCGAEKAAPVLGTERERPRSLPIPR